MSIYILSENNDLTYSDAPNYNYKTLNKNNGYLINM